MTLIELCAGSAALSLHVSGHSHLMPYMGGKYRYAKHLAEFVGPVDSVELYDVGPWGRFWRCWGVGLGADICEATTALVESGEDVEAMWNRLRTSPPPTGDAEWCAVFMVLQRLAYKSKPIAPKDGKWSSHGIARTPAYGTAKSSSFGGVKPQLPTLVRRLRAMLPFQCAGMEADARALIPRGGCVVLLDPPYVDTTGYCKDDLSRSDTLAIARNWARAGSRVLITEAEPMNGSGIPLRRQGRKRRWSDVTDWLTVFPPADGSVATPAPQLKLF